MTELFIVTDYSDKGFALYGKDTKKYSEEIKTKYKGMYKNFRHGMGWFVAYGKTDKDSNPLITKLVKLGAKKFTSEKYAAKIGKSDKDLKKAAEKKKADYLKKKGVTKKETKSKPKTKKKVASSAKKTKRAKKKVESFSPTKTKGYEAYEKEYQSIIKIMKKYKYDVIITEIADKVYKAQKIKSDSDMNTAYLLKLSSLRIILESFYEKYDEPEFDDDQEITFSNVAKMMIPNLNHTYYLSMAIRIQKLIKWVYDNQDRANEARKFLEETIDDIDKIKEFPKIAKKAKATKKTASSKKKTPAKKKAPAKTNKKPATKKKVSKKEEKKPEKKTKKPTKKAESKKKTTTKGVLKDKPTPKSTVVELKAYAKEKGLKGYSKMKKDELLKLLKIK